MACKLAIPTMSLGYCTAGHSLETKLDAAKSYGYEGIEVCYEDLVAVAGRRQCDVEFEPLCESDQMAAARKIRSMCRDRCIKIICLQPFMQYEGLLNRREHDSRFVELLTWIELARALGTDMIMMPASSLPENEVTADLDLIARDLQKAADAGQREEPHIRFAYENRCSATRIYRWEFSWDVVERVCRPNFGMCLDTFHLASLIFADPAVPSGLIPGGDKAVEMSMQRPIKRLQSHRDKIFLVQMGDAKLPNEPIVPGSLEYNSKERPWTYWSQKYRLFYGETGRGAYLPIREIAEAIFNGLGYQGWVSLELFNSRMECAVVNVPMDLARRGAISWRKLADDMGWWPSVSQTQQL